MKILERWVYLFVFFLSSYYSFSQVITITGPTTLCGLQPGAIQLTKPTPFTQYKLLAPGNVNPIDSVSGKPSGIFQYSDLSFLGANLNNGLNVLSITGSPSNVAYRVPDGIMSVDGILNEKQWRLNNYIYAPDGGSYSPYDSVPGTAGNTTNFGLLWDDTYLYIGIKVIDPTIVNNSKIYDNLEVYYDPLNWKDWYAPGQGSHSIADTSLINTTTGLAQYLVRQLRYGYQWRKDSVYSWPLTNPQRSDTVGLLAANTTFSGSTAFRSSDNPSDPGYYQEGSGYFVELAIPWKLFFNVNTIPGAGYNFGFDMTPNDVQVPGHGRDEQTVWNASNTINDRYYESNNFGNITLVDPLNFSSTNTLSGADMLVGTWNITVRTDTAVFAYPGLYCSNSASIFVTTISGIYGGVFSTSATGFTLDPASGSISGINPTVSGLFSIIYTVSFPGGICPPLVGSTYVTITGLPATPIFTYGASPYCSNTLSIAVTTVAGVSGGTYGTTAPGTSLTIDAAGTIYPSSNTVAGVFYITYTIPASSSCPPVMGTSTVTLTGLPEKPVFNYGASPYCSNVASIGVTFVSGLVGGTYTSTSTGFTIGAVSGTIIPNNNTIAGVYYVTYTIPAASGCPAVTGAANLSLTGLPATPIFNYGTAPYCSNTSIIPVTPISGITGGSYGTTAPGTTLMVNAAGSILPTTSTTSGVFYISYTVPAASGCPVVSGNNTITLTGLPATPDFNYGVTPYCSNAPGIPVIPISGIAGGSYGTTAPGTMLMVNGAGAVLPSFNTISGVYYISYTIPAASGCPVVAGTNTITLTGVSQVGGITGPASNICNGSPTGLTLSSAVGNINWLVSNDNLSFTSTGVNSLNYTSSNLTLPNYYYIATSQNGVCPLVSTTSTLVTTYPQSQAGTVVIQTALPICTNTSADLTLTGTNVGTIQWQKGGFDIVGATSTSLNTGSLTSNTSYQAVITSGAGCAPATTVSVVVTTSLCGFAAIIQNNTPLVELCLSAASTTGFTLQDASLASSGATITGWNWQFPDADASISSFAGSAGGSVNVKYTVAGTKNIILSVSGIGALPSTTTFTGYVDAVPVVSAITVSQTQVCSGSGISMNVTTTMGSIQWYVSTDSGVSYNSVVGETGLVYNPLSLTVNPIQYALVASNGVCSAMTVTSPLITVTSPPITPLFDYGNIEYCNNAGAVNLMHGIGTTSGTFAISPVANITINGVSGQITLSTSTGAGVYTVLYSVPASGGCGAASGSSTISISGIPSPPVFNYGPIAYCSNAGSINVTNVSGITGGTFSYLGGGFSVDPLTGNITGITPGLGGVFNIDYNIAAAIGCPPVSGPATVTITSAPFVSNIIPSVSPVCLNGSLGLSISGVVGTLTWYRSVDNGNSFFTIPGTNGATLNYNDPSLIANPTIYKVEAANGVCNNYITSLTSNVFVCNPTAAIQIQGGSDVCSGNAKDFKDGSVIIPNSTIIGWNWSFGSLASQSNSNIQNPTGVVFNNAVNTVTSVFLTITVNPGGVVANTSAPIQIKGSPSISSINASSNQICLNGSVTITLSGVYGNVKWNKATLGTNNYNQLADTGNSITVVPLFSAMYLPVAYNDICTPFTGSGINVSVTSPVTLNSFTYTSAPYYGAEGSICNQGQLLPLVNTMAGGFFSYSVNNTFLGISPLLNVDANTGVVDLTGSSAGQYSISYQTNPYGGCPSQSIEYPISVTSSLAGDVVSSGTGAICDGQDVNFTLTNKLGMVAFWERKNVTDSTAWQTLNKSEGTDMWTDSFSGVNTWSYRVGVKNGQCALAYSTEYLFSTILPTKPGYLTPSFQEICETPSSIKLLGKSGTASWLFTTDSTLALSDWGTALPNLSSDSIINVSPDGKYNHTYFYKAVVKSGNCPLAYTNIASVKVCEQSRFIPNALTPNSYDNNSVWNLKYFTLNDNASIKIFNRYGLEVFSTSGRQIKATPWDGSGLPAATYYYLIDQADGTKPVAGGVTIIK